MPPIPDSDAFGGFVPAGQRASDGAAAARAQLPVLRKAQLPVPVLRRERQGQAAVRLRRPRALPVQVLLAARRDPLTPPRHLLHHNSFSLIFGNKWAPFSY